MAQTYQNIAQGWSTTGSSTQYATGPTANTLAFDLYTVPASTSVIISSIAVCNTTTSNQTFSIWIRSGVAKTNAGGTASLGSTTGANGTAALFSGTTVYANSTLMITAGVTMTAAEVVTVMASASGVSFQLYGSVIT